MTEPKLIDAAEAARMMRDGATLVDIRGADEFARERIPGSSNQPVDKLSAGTIAGDSSVMIFHCRSGARTAANAAQLVQAAGPCETYILKGGIEAWKKAGLPVAVDRKQPLELMRQVQIAAGLMILVGVTLGATVNPLFYGVAGFVGAGLTVAGATGFCGMARILNLMPWNKAFARAS
jgi:rhodanese-related sulfurtransferase